LVSPSRLAGAYTVAAGLDLVVLLGFRSRVPRRFAAVMEKKEGSEFFRERPKQQGRHPPEAEL
jgi:hypothetical protein